GRKRLGVAEQPAKLVVEQKDRVLRVVEDAFFHQTAADGHQDQTEVRVGALVDIEVVIGRERRHAHAEIERAFQLLKLVAFDTVKQLSDRRLEILLYSVDRLRVVVIGFQVTADRLDDRGRVFLPGREDKLVTPDRLVSEVLLVRRELLVEEAAAGGAPAKPVEHIRRG